jgi:hypothetical protein
MVLILSLIQLLRQAAAAVVQSMHELPQQVVLAAVAVAVRRLELVALVILLMFLHRKETQAVRVQPLLLVMVLAQAVAALVQLVAMQEPLTTTPTQRVLAVQEVHLQFLAALLFMLAAAAALGISLALLVLAAVDAATEQRVP